MNKTSASPLSRASQAAAARGVLVWDFPVRVFHWLLALNFAVAWFTAESETWRLVHVTPATPWPDWSPSAAVGTDRHPPRAVCQFRSRPGGCARLPEEHLAR